MGSDEIRLGKTGWARAQLSCTRSPKLSCTLSLRLERRQYALLYSCMTTRELGATFLAPVHPPVFTFLSIL